MRRAVLIALALLGACSPSPGANEVPEAMARNQPHDGLTELRRLFAAGDVRAATQADIDTYVRIARQAQPAGSQPLSVSMLIPDFTLVLVRPFKVTPQMGMMHARQIIVPAGVGKNDDPNPLFNYYYLETGRCNVPGSHCLGAPKYDYDKAQRENYDRKQRDKEQAISEDERSQSNWGDTGAAKDKPENPGPLERLAE